MAFILPTNGLTVNFTVDNTNPDTGDTIQFTDLTNGATAWYWDFGDNTTSNLQNPTHVYLVAGEYTVTLVAWINGQIAGVNVKTDYIDAVSNLDPNAQAFILAANITDPTQQQAINTLVVDLKANNLWNNMDAIYPFVGGTADSHKYNLKDPRDLDIAYRLEYRGTPATHNAQGITFNAGGYASTWCVPGTGVFNRSYGEYIRQAFNNGWSGSFIGSVFGYKVDPDPSIDAIGVNNLIGISINIVYGYLNTSIISNTEGYLYNKDAVIYTNNAPNNGPDPGVIYIGAMNTGTSGNGTPWGEYSQRNLAFAHLGQGLNLAQQQALNSIVQQYQTTLGRQV